MTDNDIKQKIVDLLTDELGPELSIIAAELMEKELQRRDRIAAKAAADKIKCAGNHLVQACLNAVALELAHIPDYFPPNFSGTITVVVSEGGNIRGSFRSGYVSRTSVNGTNQPPKKPVVYHGIVFPDIDALAKHLGLVPIPAKAQGKARWDGGLTEIQRGGYMFPDGKRSRLVRGRDFHLLADIPEEKRDTLVLPDGSPFGDKG